jgi:hypothetical protein
MKKIVTLYCIAVLFVLLASCGSIPASAPVPSQASVLTDELDEALREASTYFNDRIPEGSKVVYLNIRSDYPDLSEYILSILSENAVNDGRFSVVDRQQLDEIRAELDFQMSGEVSDESAQSIGRLLGAEGIVSGTLTKIGPLYRVQVKAIEVETAGVQGQWSKNLSADGTLITALAERVVPAAAGGTAPVVAQSRTQTANTTASNSSTTVSVPAQTRTQTASAAVSSPSSEISSIVLQESERTVNTASSTQSTAVSLVRSVTFDANGANGRVPSEQSVQSGESISIPGVTEMIHATKTFDGWNTKADGTGTSYMAGEVFIVNTNIQFFAQWKEIGYNVGDAGPAGGIIFYDKGNNIGGWRYLEAAPADLGISEWQTSFSAIGTKEGIGSGKQNSQLIGEKGRAVLIVLQYRQGGYSDWFLPSSNELDLMYINLKMKDLGRFSDNWYWSSSEKDRAGSAWKINFANGSLNYNDGGASKRDRCLVRAIRQF